MGQFHIVVFSFLTFLFGIFIFSDPLRAEVLQNEDTKTMVKSSSRTNHAAENFRWKESNTSASSFVFVQGTCWLVRDKVRTCFNLTYGECRRAARSSGSIISPPWVPLRSCPVEEEEDK